jgi:hypothetical protein
MKNNHGVPHGRPRRERSQWQVKPTGLRPDRSHRTHSGAPALAEPTNWVARTQADRTSSAVGTPPEKTSSAAGTPPEKTSSAAGTPPEKTSSAAQTPDGKSRHDAVDRYPVLQRLAGEPHEAVSR